MKFKYQFYEQFIFVSYDGGKEYKLKEGLTNGKNWSSRGSGYGALCSDKG